MVQITLPKYLQFINELIDESRLAEAVTHSRHLLEQHPRHIDTYRSLGKALLEQGDYAGAVDIFQRVLSAAPADFIAHVGLAIVHKAGDRWKQALWHMERAFEVEPYNAAVRTELQDLYGRRDGLAPAQVELTRGALARLYVHGGLYQRAILELRELLTEDPERIDLQLLLAEAHWRADERVEAAERCEEILALLPNCIDANAMLADIMLATGDTGSAQSLLERLQALTQLSQSSLGSNPLLAATFRLPGAPSLPREIHVERMSDEEALGLRQQAEAGAWISELDLETEGTEDDLDWLQDLQEEGEGIRPPATPGQEVPDWLGAAAPAAVHEAGQPVDQAEPVAGETLPGELPEWVHSEAEEDTGWAATPEEPVEAPGWMAAGSEDISWLDAPVEAGTPDWLRDEQPGEAQPGDPEDQPGGKPVLPDWLDEVVDEDSGAETDEGASANVADSGDHLEQAFAAWEAPGALPHEPELQEDFSVPAFADFVETGGEPALWEDEADREGIVMEERNNEQDEQPEEQDPEEEASELDWLHQLGQSEPTTEPGAKQGEAGASEAEDLPDWLGDEGELDWLSNEDNLDLPARLAAESPAGEDLSWLDQIAGGQAEPPEEMPTLEWPEEEGTQPPPEPAATAAAEEETAAAGELGWLDEPASEGGATGDSWLDELAEKAGRPEGSEAGEEPHLFSDDIGDLDWLDEPVGEPGLAEGVAAFAATEGLDWLGELEEPSAAEEAAVEADSGRAEESEPTAEVEPAQESGPDWLAGTDSAEEDLDWLLEPEPGEPAEKAAEAAAPDIFIAEEGDEPVLDWLEASPESAEETGDVGFTHEAPVAPAELEDAIAWLDDIPAGEATGGDDVPEDLEEAMAWLERLAAQQGAPLEELPSVTAAVGAQAEAPGEGAPQAEDDDLALPADLPELELPEAEAPDPNLEWMEALAGVEAVEAAAPAQEAGEFDVPADLDEAMAWLEELTAEETAEAEELPDWLLDETQFGEPVEDEVELAETAASLTGPPASASEAPATGDDVPEDLDEALAWLEQLAEQQGTPDEELISLQAGESPSPEPEGWEEIVAQVEDEAMPEFEVTPEMDTPPAMQVPDVAMMYLDTLLVGSGRMAGTGADHAEPEAALVDELPDDAESALAWLEQLATEPARPAADESFDIPEELDASLDWLEEIQTPSEAAVEVVEEVGVSEWKWTEELPEPEGWEEAEIEAAAGPEAAQEEIVIETEAAGWEWTEELPEPAGWEEAEEEVETPQADVVEEAEAGEWKWTEELPEPERWEEGATALEEALAEPVAGQEAPAEMFDDIPEDPDEAMAWLERLAARQGAPLDELPSVDEVQEDVETPAWLAREMAEAETAAAEIPAGETLGEELEWPDETESLDWSPVDTVEERTSAVMAPEELETGFDLEILEGEEMEPVLPDWLAGGDESWPDELTDIDSWLVAEEEASRVDLQVPEQKPAPAPQPVEPAPQAGPLPTERIPAPAGMDASRLEKARATLDSGDVESAIAAYQELMHGGTGLNVLIADLEMETESNEQPMLLRLLGDAYMENGQLTRALEAYRRALDLL